MKKIYLVSYLMMMFLLLNIPVTNAQTTNNCPPGSKTFHIRGLSGVNSSNTVYLTGFTVGYAVQITNGVNVLNVGSIAADGTYSYTYAANAAVKPDLICVSTVGVPCCLINVPALISCSFGQPDATQEFDCNPVTGFCKIFLIVADGASVQLLDNNGNVIPALSELSRVDYAVDPTKDVVCVTYRKLPGTSIASVIECTTTQCCTKPITPGATLPLTWGNVSVVLDNGNAKLNWTTIFEAGTHSFVIEKSTDGRNFSAVGTVAAVGNSENKVSYSFTDNTDNFGAAFYRLKQLDIDGAFSYSKTLYINGKKTGNAITKLAPNPTIDGEFQVLGISTSELTRANVQIFNSAGQQVDYKISGANSIRLGTNAPKGLYILRVNGQSVRLMKQ